MKPFSSIIRFIVLFFNGKIGSNKNYKNMLIRVDKQEYIIFRHIEVKREVKKSTSSLLILRFKFNHTSLTKDRIESFFQIPIFTGLPGFEEKLWTFCPKSGYFQGLYQWNSQESVNKYLNSFAVKFLEKKACPKSVSKKIIRNMLLKEFLKNNVPSE